MRSSSLTLQAISDVATWSRKTVVWAWSTFLATLGYLFLLIVAVVIVCDCAAGVLYVFDRVHAVHRHGCPHVAPVAPKVDPVPAPAPVAPHGKGCAAGCHCGKVGCDCAALNFPGVDAIVCDPPR